MSRSIEVAAALGSAALAGIGVAPFLYRPDPPDAWFKLHWPRVLDDSDALSLLRHLASTRRPAVVTFEVHCTRGRVTHFVGVAKSYAERLRHSFATFLPDVLLEEDESPPLNLARAVVLRLGTRERALRTDAPIEVARSVVGAIAGTTGTTVVQWQIGTRLAPLWVPKDSVGLPSTGRAIGQAFRYGLEPREGKARTALENKVGDHGFRVTLRVASSIAEPPVAQGVLRAVVGGLRVAEAPGVHFKVRRCDPHAVTRATVPRHFTMAMNVAELLGPLGWPLGDGAYPGVVRMGSRRLPVPVSVSATGRVIGEGNHPSTRRPAALSTKDWLSTLCIGPTGVGKSTLLANVVLADIAAGRGVVVLEPKGDLVDDILARIPSERERDVVVLDPTDVDASVGLNPLRGGAPDLLADHVLAVFRGLYGSYLGPRTADVLHGAALTLARSKHPTLVALPVLLTDESFRRELTKNVRGDLALGPFWAWYESLSGAERGQVIGPVMNKTRFLLRDRVRHVLGQVEPKFDITSVFTDRKILLVPLRKGVLGSETASLIGSLVVASLWQAALARSRVAPERRHPVSVVIDEFQDFLHLPTDLADVLATARSYGVSLLLAHQHLAQLTPEMRAAVLANARNKICFRLSAEDAGVISRGTDVLDTKDLQSLGRYEIYASLVADGATQPFFSATTNPLPKVSSNGSRAREFSRNQYGIAPSAIDAELETLWHRDATATSRSVGSRRRQARPSETDGAEK